MSVEYSYNDALKSFLGYLEGTSKAKNTIKNYRYDLHSFRKYLERSGVLNASIGEISKNDLSDYHNYLKSAGLKTNSRRRRVITVRRMLQYLSKRKKLKDDISVCLTTPNKIERIPVTVKSRELVDRIRNLPYGEELDARNRAILWLLAETGCRVSELSFLRFNNITVEGEKSAIRFEGKFARSVPITFELAEACNALRIYSKKDNEWLFRGFNKVGPLKGPLTSRGIELLVKVFSKNSNFSGVTPRTFRHSIVIEWFDEGIPQIEIQSRLGLKTDYSFRIYKPLFKSKKKTTSNDEMNQKES